MLILHILDHSIPLHSGYTFRTRAILREQRRLGWETEHLTSPKHGLEAGPGPEQEEVDGLRFFRTPVPADWRMRVPPLDQWAITAALTRRLERVARELKPDILHAHSPALNGLAAVRVGRRLGIPVVYEVRAFWEDAAVDHGTSREGGPRYRATRAMETYVFRNADAVTTICEGLRGDIIGRGIPAARVTVIPNAVDIEQFRQGGEPDPELRTRLGLDDARVIGFIGSFYAYEGLSLLLDALPRILEKAPDARILMVGGGFQDAALRQQAQKLGIADKIVFTGRVPHAEVTRYYDLVDLLVYPRLSMRLTDLVTPLKPLEAMAQGRLLLASDVGGHRELIEDGRTGALFRAGDSDALAERALDILGHPERWPAIREAGRQFVETERNWAVSVGRYADVYRRLAGQAMAASGVATDTTAS
jgi:PEP-CTERM/exosortase A-associated glycosyltransferase